VLRGLHPALQALIWAQALALVLYLNWGERRRQRLYFLAAWFFAALATMGKGPAGFGLPALAAVAYVVITRRSIVRIIRDLTRMEIVAGLLVVLCVALPWFVAMYARHGQPFTDRLLFHDMFKRAFTHVHDTNEGDDVSFRFYVWQLGYATFPWIGLLPAGLVWWLRGRAKREEEPRGDVERGPYRKADEAPASTGEERARRDLALRDDAAIFLGTWFLFAFALFSAMLTKFHHYILPAVPPAAMLVGVLLDGLLVRALASPEGTERSPRDVALYAAGLATAVIAGVGGVARMFAGKPISGALIAGVGLVALALVVVHLDPASPAGGVAEGGVAEGGAAEADGSYEARFERILLGAASAVGAALVIAVGRDLAANLEGMPGQIRLMHLITYNYRRPWPASLDFGATLWGFTIAAAVLTFALVAVRLRRHVVAALLALGFAFGAWGLGVYFMKISPHWGQRETTLAYYQAARELPGPLVAYQMNWKGENFYTGNHVPAFVSSGKRFQDYVLEEKKKGVRVFYFVTEHGRTGTLQNELTPPHDLEKLTTPELDNKFLLVRARFD
jgi:4-amino-4-deoxy-L-arabinose transferase-like glycosyltransferase